MGNQHRRHQPSWVIGATSSEQASATQTTTSLRLGVEDGVTTLRMHAVVKSIDSVEPYTGNRTVNIDQTFTITHTTVWPVPPPPPPTPLPTVVARKATCENVVRKKEEHRTLITARLHLSCSPSCANLSQHQRISCWAITQSSG